MRDWSSLGFPPLKPRLWLICKVVGHRVHSRVGSVILAKATVQNVSDLLQGGRVEKMALSHLRKALARKAPGRLESDPGGYHDLEGTKHEGLICTGYAEGGCS